MRLIYIVGIILILTFPTSFSVASHGTSISTYGRAYDYNFTTMNSGTFPTNNSWIGFSSFNVTSPSSINVEQGHELRGLQISSYGYNGVGNQFLNISVLPNSTFSLRMTFSWNYNNSEFKTGNIIKAHNGSNVNFNYQFGPLYNKETVLSGERSAILGPNPAVASFYTLDLAWLGNQDLIYTNLLRGWNATMHMPYAVRPKGQFNGQNFTLSIGGTYSNITIYNIFLDKGAEKFIAPGIGSALNFKHETLYPGKPGLNSTSPGWLPLVDQTANSVLYSGAPKNPGVFALNYYNNTSVEIRSLPQNFSEITASEGGGFGYFLYSNKNSSMVISVNLYSLKSLSIKTNAYYGIGSHLLISGKTAYLIGSNGTSEVILNSQNELIQSGFSYRNIGLLAASGYLNGNLTVSFFDNGTTNITEYSLIHNGTIHEKANYSLSPYGSAPEYLPGNNSLPASAEISAVNEGYNETVILGNNGSEPIVLTGNYSFSRTSGNPLVLNAKEQVYVVSGSLIYSTNMKAGSHFLYIADNLSFGLAIYNGTVELYYNGSTPFSGNGISVLFNPPTVIGGNVSLKYSITSSLNYTVKAQIGNMTFNPKFGYLNFTSVPLGNGTYSLILMARNTAGYSSSVNVTVHVDNFMPLVSTNPGNGSVVLESSSLQVNITGLQGPINSTLRFGDLQPAVFNGNSFQTFFPGETGPIKLILNVSDEFGITRNYSFEYQIQNVSSNGYSSNIIPGSFFANGSLNASWSPVKFISHYWISVKSDSYEYGLNSTTNYTHLNLPSGTYQMNIQALLDNSTWITIVNETFTVQLYDPGLNLTYTPDHYFSFFGDSRNNSLNISATSNISVSFNLKVVQNSITVFESNGSGNMFSVTLNSSYPFLQKNGIFKANITAVEGSGRTSWKEFNFSVNNTLPLISLDSTRIYTNRTHPTLNITPGRNETIAYYFENGTLGGYITNSNSPLTVYGRISRMSLEALTEWGNYHITNFTVIESSSLPAIKANVSSTILVWRNSIQLTYGIKDPVNLTFVKIEVNNRSIYHARSATGILNLTLPKDGNYTILLKAMDVCGNQNHTAIQNVVCEYYPHFEGINASIGLFMGFAHLSSTVHGNDLESVNYTWKIDGSLASASRSMYAVLMPGSHNITFLATYHGNSIESVHHVFTFGFLPELALVGAITGLLLYRKYGGENNMENAIGLVKNNIGRQKNEVITIARKNKIRVKTVENAIGELTSSGEIRLMPDPDGVMYLMSPKKRQ